MYVLLGPQQQVELQDGAVDVALFLRDKVATEWLVYRQLTMPSSFDISTLARHLLIAEEVEKHALEAVYGVESNRQRQ